MNKEEQRLYKFFTLNDKERKLYRYLTRKEAQYRRLKTVDAIDKKFNKNEADNYHSENSILMAIHYGTSIDVERVKHFIVKQNRTLCPNASYTARIKMTSKFLKMHREIISNSKAELAGLYDLRIPLSNIGMSEAISRAIRDCFLRNKGKLDVSLMDKTIKAVGKRTPLYKSVWKDFVETFNITTEDGNYINPYCI